MRINNINRFMATLLSSLLVLVFCAGQVIGGENPQLVGQLEKLSAEVDQLKIALNQARSDQAASSGQQGMGGMKMDMQGMKGMNKQDTGGMDMQGMGGMKMGMQGMGGMGKQDMGGMKMQGMGGMKMNMRGMEKMKMMGTGMMGKMAQKGLAQSSLPGYPGLSHLYHIGATDLFLDHGDHIQLSSDQKARLYKAKEKMLLDNASFDRKIDQAEQDLWTLTGSDKPDSQKIETKIREIEKLRGDKRMAFILAVGQSTQVLADEQLRLLVGFSPETKNDLQSEGDNKE